MVSSQKLFIGIDPTASRHAFTYAVLDQGCKLVMLAAGELEDLLDLIKKTEITGAAVNAPPRPNQGLVKELLEKN